MQAEIYTRLCKNTNKASFANTGASRPYAKGKTIIVSCNIAD